MIQALPEHAYGLILTFDGYGASKEACADQHLLYNILAELPRHIGMRPLGYPHIVRVDEAGIAGLSGFTFIMESHISIHTYEERGFVTADVYSCKTFDHAKAAAYLADKFHIRAFDIAHHVRGARFHHPAQLNSHALDPSQILEMV